MSKQIEFELFSEQPYREFPYQVLPRDGDTQYFGVVCNQDSSKRYLDYLLNEVPWKNDEAVIYGKHYITDRKVAWYGDGNFSYKYSGKTRVAIPWSKPLLELRELVEKHSGASYNSCLLNLYENGTQGMGWHHDDEKGLGENSNIASLSFGAERRFDFRHKGSKEKIPILLEHGSLLVMAGTTQSNWQHHLPKTTKITQPRVNLTFRKMIIRPLN